MTKTANFCSRFQLKKCSSGDSLPVDRLSSLPDEILELILSFLPFKEVAMASIISRRWLKLWMYHPILNFHAPISETVDETERQNYVNWVNCVLRLHEGHYLKEFKVVCFLGKHNWKDVDSWLEYALARKVENLELNFLYLRIYPANNDENYVFPETLLNFSHENYVFPKYDFKSLKSLSLKRVNVSAEAINFFLVNCPNLERLEVSGNKKLINLVISDPTLVLKYLQITSCYDLKVLTISNFNLVSLNIQSLDYIDADGCLTLTDLPMLVELTISGASDSLRICFSQSSSCHSQLEALTLETRKLEEIIQLSNLSQLTKLKRLCITFGVRHDKSLTKLFPFLNSCPHLMEFVLMVRTVGPERTSRALCKSENCSMKCLKVFEFKGYFGRVSDVELIMHVVDNAPSLEKVIIDPIHPSVSYWPKTTPWLIREHEARSVALLQFDGLRESIPSHVDIIIR